MQGTRTSCLKEIINWVANKPKEKDYPQSNIYWIYGLPGIGKTALAHSVCANLHDQKQLVGAFFCKRDHPVLSQPIYILPTLIHNLAMIFPRFRKTVADCLRNDPNLKAETMKDSLFLDFLDNIPRDPNDPLVFVIDAFDECGDRRSRPALLRLLTGVATSASWLKIIITSRHEANIQQFFDKLTRPSYLRYDLARDKEANDDLRTFAQREFEQVAQYWGLPAPWPEESLLKRVISRANGLFIFIKTLSFALERCENPTKYLEATAEEPAGAELEPLYKLYSSILKLQIGDSISKFQRMIGVLLAAAPYRALCEETIAELAGLTPDLVKRWVGDLSSLLYRDEGTNGGIRVRHLSVSDFLVSNDYPSGYQINIQDANMQLGIACLKTMVYQLSFNICRLEDSRLANAQIEDLPSRIEKNIPDSLQYSSLHWADHLCFTPCSNDLRVWESPLREFFEGCRPLFWIEVLSLMGMVPIGAPVIRRVILWVKVSPAPARIHRGSYCL